MKTIKKQTIMILTILFITMVGCTNKDNDTATPNNGDQMTQGSWKVSYYSDSGKDETAMFNGYTFVFESSGSITATNGSASQTGSWSTGTDDSQSKLFLTFGNVSPFDELTDDWHILEHNTSTIKLEDISGGNGGKDYLTFIKN